MCQSPTGGSETDKQETDSQEQQHALQGDTEGGAKPESRCDAFRSLLSRKVTTTVGCLICILVPLLIIIVVLLVVVIVGVFRGHEPWCSNGWLSYQQKCYYFYKAEGNWDSSRNNCSALGTSLAEIDSLQELTFLMRHKGPGSHWIGLRREGEGQPWKWVNGTEFNNLFNVTEGADCVYLNNENILSSNCQTKKKWICNKPSQH